MTSTSPEAALFSKLTGNILQKISDLSDFSGMMLSLKKLKEMLDDANNDTSLIKANSILFCFDYTFMPLYLHWRTLLPIVKGQKPPIEVPQNYINDYKSVLCLVSDCLTSLIKLIQYSHIPVNSSHRITLFNNVFARTTVFLDILLSKFPKEEEIFESLFKLLTVLVHYAFPLSYQSISRGLCIAHKNRNENGTNIQSADAAKGLANRIIQDRLYISLSIHHALSCLPATILDERKLEEAKVDDPRKNIKQELNSVSEEKGNDYRRAFSIRMAAISFIQSTLQGILRVYNAMKSEFAGIKFSDGLELDFQGCELVLVGGIFPGVSTKIAEVLIASTSASFSVERSSLLNALLGCLSDFIFVLKDKQLFPCSLSTASYVTDNSKSLPQKLPDQFDEFDFLEDGDIKDPLLALKWLASVSVQGSPDEAATPAELPETAETVKSMSLLTVLRKSEEECERALGDETGQGVMMSVSVDWLRETAMKTSELIIAILQRGQVTHLHDYREETNIKTEISNIQAVLENTLSLLYLAFPSICEPNASNLDEVESDSEEKTQLQQVRQMSMQLLTAIAGLCAPPVFAHSGRLPETKQETQHIFKFGNIFTMLTVANIEEALCKSTEQFAAAVSSDVSVSLSRLLSLVRPMRTFALALLNPPQNYEIVLDENSLLESKTRLLGALMAASCSTTEFVNQEASDPVPLAESLPSVFEAAAGYTAEEILDERKSAAKKASKMNARESTAYEALQNSVTRLACRVEKWSRGEATEDLEIRITIGCVLKYVLGGPGGSFVTGLLGGADCVSDLLVTLLPSAPSGQVTGQETRDTLLDENTRMRRAGDFLEPRFIIPPRLSPTEQVDAGDTESSPVSAQFSLSVVKDRVAAIQLVDCLVLALGEGGERTVDLESCIHMLLSTHIFMEENVLADRIASHELLLTNSTSTSRFNILKWARVHMFTVLNVLARAFRALSQSANDSRTKRRTLANVKLSLPAALTLLCAPSRIISEAALYLCYCMRDALHAAEPFASPVDMKDTSPVASLLKCIGQCVVDPLTYRLAFQNPEMLFVKHFFPSLARLSIVKGDSAQAFDLPSEIESGGRLARILLAVVAHSKQSEALSQLAEMTDALCKTPVSLVMEESAVSEEETVETPMWVLRTLSLIARRLAHDVWRERLDNLSKRNSDETVQFAGTVRTHSRITNVREVGGEDGFSESEPDDNDRSEEAAKKRLGLNTNYSEDFALRDTIFAMAQIIGMRMRMHVNERRVAARRTALQTLLNCCSVWSRRSQEYLPLLHDCVSLPTTTLLKDGAPLAVTADASALIRHASRLCPTPGFLRNWFADDILPAVVKNLMSTQPVVDSESTRVGTFMETRRMQKEILRMLLTFCKEKDIITGNKSEPEIIFVCLRFLKQDCAPEVQAVALRLLHVMSQHSPVLMQFMCTFAVLHVHVPSDWSDATKDEGRAFLKSLFSLKTPENLDASKSEEAENSVDWTQRMDNLFTNEIAQKIRTVDLSIGETDIHSTSCRSSIVKIAGQRLASYLILAHLALKARSAELASHLPSDQVLAKQLGIHTLGMPSFTTENIAALKVLSSKSMVSFLSRTCQEPTCSFEGMMISNLKGSCLDPSLLLNIVLPIWLDSEGIQSLRKYDSSFQSAQYGRRKPGVNQQALFKVLTNNNDNIPESSTF